MLLSLEWFFTSVWGRRILAFAGIVILALGIRAYFIHEGKLRELEANQQKTLQQVTASQVDDRDDLKKQLAASVAALNVATAQIAAAQQTIQLLQTQLASLAAQRQSADAALAKVPDSALHGYIASKLALRPANDTTPGYEPTEERAIAACLTDAPLCEQSRVLLQKTNDAKDAQLTAEQQKESLVRTDYGALLTYTQKLEGNYTTLYNTFAAKKRGPRCIWIWKCSAQTIKTPKPADITLPADLAIQH